MLLQRPLGGIGASDHQENGSSRKWVSRAFFSRERTGVSVFELGLVVLLILLPWRLLRRRQERQQYRLGQAYERASRGGCVRVTVR